jgi:hypothetical protein
MGKHEKSLPTHRVILEHILMWLRVDVMLNLIVAIGTVLLCAKELGYITGG